ncbi:unnamed protein product, partial [Meganyctiphanes norvegica]
MSEDSAEHLAAKAASQAWVLSLNTFGGTFELLNEQLDAEDATWRMSEAVVILKHWLPTLATQREQMMAKSAVCPAGVIKTELEKYINDNYRYDVGVKSRVQVAERFIERSNAALVPVAAGAVVAAGGSGGNFLTRLSLETFSGDLTRYEEWKRNTKSLLTTIADDAIKVRRIRDSLSGQAKLYAGDTGDHILTEEAMWDFLDKRYKDQWAGNLAIGSNMLDLFRNPISTVDDLMKIEDKLHNVYLKADQRKYTMEQLTTTLFLATLPDPITTEIIREVKTEHPHKNIFTWSDLGNHPHQIIQNFSRNHEVSDPLDLLTFNQCSIASPITGRSRGNQRPGFHKVFRARTPYVDRVICRFCERNHKTIFCPRYNTDAKRRNRVKELDPGVCFVCLFIH